MATAHAVELRSALEDTASLGELLEALDFPPGAVSSFEDYEHGVGITYILCDTPAEQRAAAARVRSMLPLWAPLLTAPLRGIAERDIERAEWSESWKRYFHAFRASRRIVIAPAWEDPPETAPDEILLAIDPGMSFGTGSHATTMGCLQFLDEFAENHRNASLVDAGCGTAILALAARRLGYAPVFAFDYDAAAVENARANLARADVRDISLVQADVHTVQPPFRADLVAANLLAHILMEAREHLVTLPRPGGMLLLSGILDEQYPPLRDAFAALGCREIATRPIDGWTTALLQVP